MADIPLVVADLSRGEVIAEHVVIRLPEFVAGSRETPEIGVFTQAHSVRRPVPWRKIDTGETVWMKWSGGPVVGRARIKGFACFADCTPEQLREAVRGYSLFDVEEYWSRLHPSFYGMAIYLAEEEWLDPLLEANLGRQRESWVVLEKSEVRAAFNRLPDEPRPSSGRRRRSLSASTRFRILRRDSFSCRYCGRSAPGVVLHIDHLHPVSQGGDDSDENLATACQDCNLGKSDRLLDAGSPA